MPPAGLTEAVYALEALLATPDGSGDAARGAEVAREALLGLAARQPVMVAVDDLDRATATLHRFLHRLFAAATARSLPLVVVTLHPQWTDALPGRGTGGTGWRCRRCARWRPDGCCATCSAGRPADGGDRPAAAAGRRQPGAAVAYVASPDGRGPCRKLAPGGRRPAGPPGRGAAGR